jgi:hypothetical protein
MTRTVRIRSLRRGSIFTIDGEKHRLLYVNDCRAYVEKAGKETVTVCRLNRENGLPEEFEFDAKGRAFNISPGTIVEVDRRSDRSALGRFPGRNGHCGEEAGL